MRKVSIYLFVFIFTLVSLKAQVEPPLNNGWYEISTLDHLRWISENTASWDKNMKLMNDIDAIDTKNWNNGEGFSPISPGYPKYPNQKDFTGIFEGNGKTISNLFINRPNEDEVGLFGWLLIKGPIIKNINLVNCDITGRSGVGAIVGYMQYTVLQNVNVQGKVKGSTHVGMLKMKY
jgi:hypothetical protein